MVPGLSRVGGAQSDPPPPLALAAWAQARQGWVSAESSPRVSAVWSFSEELAEPWAGCTGRIRGWHRGGCGRWRESECMLEVGPAEHRTWIKWMVFRVSDFLCSRGSWSLKKQNKTCHVNLH